jgi:hypothetical protein
MAVRARDGALVGVTFHALKRAHERLWPGVDLTTAAIRLEMLIQSAATSRVRPDWFRGDSPDLFIHLTDDVVGLVMDGNMVTIVVRGVPSDRTLTHKRERRAQRARARRARRQSEKRGEGRRVVE